MPRLAAICGYVLAILALTALTWVLWQHRFVPVSSAPALDLAYTPAGVGKTAFGVIDFQGKSLKMSAGENLPRLEYQWTRLPPAPYAHVAISASCDGIELGRMPWDDARIILTWVDASGNMVPGHLPLWSGRGSHPSESRDMVVPLERVGTLPRILVENRGAKGNFIVHSLVIQPAEHRPGILWAALGLVLAWAGLIAAALRKWGTGPGIGRMRIAMAGLLWVGFAWVSCLPGPWIPWHPIFRPFPISPVSAPMEAPPVEKKAPPLPQPLPLPVAPAANTPAVTESPAVTGNPAPTATATAATEPAPAASAVTPPQRPSLDLEDEKPPERLGGGLVRWFLNTLPNLKRPVHLIAFAGLTAILCMLAGSSRAAWAALALGGISEFCQWAFGFGFDWGDIVDLVFDSTAVITGVLLWRWISARWGRLPISERLRSRSQAQSPASNT